MNNFRAPTRAGNVVHRLDLPSVTTRRTRRLIARRRAEAAALRDAAAAKVEARKHPRQSAPEPEFVLPTPAVIAPVTPPPATTQVVIREVEREVPVQVKDEEARRQLELLERRLAKMTQMLEARDMEIGSRSANVDHGVASIYRGVQGIEGEGEQAEQKKELMSLIFEANLKLRERVTSASSDAE